MTRIRFGAWQKARLRAAAVAVATAGAVVSVTHPATSEMPIIVTTSADSGPGSLRQALVDASQSATTRPIIIVSERDIEIASPLTYDGTIGLVIIGAGQEVSADANHTLLHITQGADVEINDLDFEGPGDFSINRRGDGNGAPGKGIFLDVRDDQTGTVHLTLRDVSVSNVAYHGVHVSDCDLADACGAGSGGGGDGSDASISVVLESVEVDEVGQGMFDADGVRIDERGRGDITFAVFDSSFSDVGADGVELDEGDSGSINSTMVQVEFVDNGGYCASAALEPFLPSPRDAEFRDGELAPADVPPEVTGSPDDRCIERSVSLYPSGSVGGYEFSIDFDDGIDIDEAGDGDLLSVMVESNIIANLDEGVDFDEEDSGNATVLFVRTLANDNTDDGIRLSESGPGDVNGLSVEVEAIGNGGNGMRFDESGEGTITVRVERSRTTDNDDGDKSGVRVSREGDQPGTLDVVDSQIEDGIDARNVTVNEDS